jgi:hypothetical protein
MSVPAVPRWPAAALVAGTLAGVAVLAVAIVRYPANLDDPGAPVFLVAAGVLLAAYLVLALRALRSPADGQRAGLVFGLVAGAFWSVEIWAGGPALLDRATESLVGGVCVGLAAVVTVAAGVAVGVRGGRRAGLRAGMFAGLASGIAVCCAAPIMTMATHDRLATRADYRAQFASSGAHDMAAFLVGDIAAASISHLFINLALGLAGAGVAALWSVASTSHASPYHDRQDTA